MTDEEPDADDGRIDTEYDTGTQDAISSGVKVRAKLKRGTGTRDQDVLLLEGRGANADEAAADFEAALERAEANDWGDRLRAIQPDEQDE